MNNKLKEFAHNVLVSIIFPAIMVAASTVIVVLVLKAMDVIN